MTTSAIPVGLKKCIRNQEDCLATLDQKRKMQKSGFSNGIADGCATRLAMYLMRTSSGIVAVVTSISSSSPGQIRRVQRSPIKSYKAGTGSDPAAIVLSAGAIVIALGHERHRVEFHPMREEAV
jgi:hypothetical protein